MRCINLILSPEEADAYLGWQPGATQALITDRRELEPRLENLAGALPRSMQNDVTLHLVPGQIGRMTEVTQSAFVHDYSLGVPGGLAPMADPGIGVLGEGFSLALWAGTPTPKGISLRVDLASAEIQQSHTRSEFRLPSGSSLSLQQPLALAQNLRTACTLDTDQALLLVTLGRENSRQLLFTVLRAQPYGSS